MEEQYTLEYLEKTFLEHSVVFQENVKKQMAELKEKDPDVEWKSSFNLAAALCLMVQEIDNLKRLLSLKK